MSTSSQMRKSEVGEVRPSQTITTYGVGSLVDLPNLSVIVMGLEDWQITFSSEITEERLLRSAQSMLGPQVTKFLTPPRGPETGHSQTSRFDESRTIGIPVAPFPRWMVCSKCRLLAPLKSGLFEAKTDPFRTDKTCYVHHCTTQGKPPLVVPARFLVTCDRGHLDDFPWLQFVHNKEVTDCNGPLKMLEYGPSGEMADVTIKCEQCGKSRRLSEAVGPDGAKNLPPCEGRRPHLREYESKGCDSTSVRPISLGASNLWFPIVISALSVPQSSDDLGGLIEEYIAEFSDMEGIQFLKFSRRRGLLKDFAKYSDEEIWEKYLLMRNSASSETEDPDDLKSPEWMVLSNPSNSKTSRSFKLRQVRKPETFNDYFDKIVLVEKLREVKALVGFTRIMSPRDFDNPNDLPENRRADISRKRPTWLPASETRGEGIFFQFDEAKVNDWVQKNRDYSSRFMEAHTEWKKSKQIPNPEVGFPGIRFVLLHTFAHALIRQLSVECGYTTASLSERIYSRNPEDGCPMAGVLIYTSAPDSEGTLGGLCALGEPAKLGRHIKRALEKIGLCSSDPLCSEHELGDGDKLHGAACHSCGFLPETSCERGNKFLDRASLVQTLESKDLAFFG